MLWLYLSLASCLLKNPSKTNMYMKFLVRGEEWVPHCSMEPRDLGFLPSLTVNFLFVAERKLMLQFPNLVNGS